jgi:hypothetical protein
MSDFNVERNAPELHINKSFWAVEMLQICKNIWVLMFIAMMYYK